MPRMCDCLCYSPVSALLERQSIATAVNCDNLPWFGSALFLHSVGLHCRYSIKGTANRLLYGAKWHQFGTSPSNLVPGNPLLASVLKCGLGGLRQKLPVFPQTLQSCAFQSVPFLLAQTLWAAAGGVADRYQNEPAEATQQLGVTSVCHALPSWWAAWPHCVWPVMVLFRYLASELFYGAPSW